MTVEEARQQRVCRVCAEPIKLKGPMVRDWYKRFSAICYPERVELDYGNEFAHSSCVAIERGIANSVPN